jgi:hypothetical protein
VIYLTVSAESHHITLQVIPGMGAKLLFPEAFAARGCVPKEARLSILDAFVPAKPEYHLSQL